MQTKKESNIFSSFYLIMPLCSDSDLLFAQYLLHQGYLDICRQSWKESSDISLSESTKATDILLGFCEHLLIKKRKTKLANLVVRCNRLYFAWILRESIQDHYDSLVNIFITEKAPTSGYCPFSVLVD